jgi:N-methylhydantoinase B
VAELEKGAPTFDGVRLALITNRLEGIVRKMMNTLLRTGRSGVLNTARDFSCCIVTRENELLVWAESLPIHLLSGPDLMAKAMMHFHPRLRRGDAFLHNSPYHGNSHPADHSILVPVIDEDGVHHFTLLAKAHQADCGNAAPTTYSATARDVYEEGALIFPVVQVQRDYRDCEDVIRMCETRIRVPEQWRGDYLAMLGAARIGERELLGLAGELGWETLHEYTREWFDYSEQRMIAAIVRLPSGRVTRTGAHDPFPGVPDGIPVKATVEVRSEEAMIEVDLRDNIDCVPCGLNLSEATARTGAMLGVFNSIDHTVPTNAGSFRRLVVHLRENCVVGMPRHPTSCSAATTNLADRVTNAVQSALAELSDEIGLAECGLGMPPAWAVISGFDPRDDNQPFVNQIFFAVTGGAGAPTADGWLQIGHVGNAGMMFRDSVEIDELHFPIRVHVQRVIADSEGAGRFRGAAGAYVEFGPVDTSLEAMYPSDGTLFPAQGVRGGLPGAPALQYKRELDGELTELPSCGRVALQPGETIISMSCGGGGYGPPYERAPKLVRRDVLEGWVTKERAEQVYGVVLDEAGEVDEHATEELQVRLRGASPPNP